MHRDMGQQHIAEGWGVELRGNARLEAIDAQIDWAPLSRLVAPIHSARRGRRSYPPLMMLKALLLAQWYQLSDPELEEALSDRLSFRRFVGLGLAEETPDETTLLRFRHALARNTRDRRIFEEVNRQLDSKGLILRQGTLLDATLVKAQPRPPAVAKPGEPEPKVVDPDANFTRQGRAWHYGYKAHLGVDQDSGLVRDAELTPAKIYESLVADALIQGDERAVYADKAYEHKERRKRLKALGIKDRIMHRGHKHQDELPHWQQRRNDLIRPIRRNVERTFGTLKRRYGFSRVRFYNLARNTTHLLLLCIAMNLRRMLVLATCRA